MTSISQRQAYACVVDADEEAYEKAMEDWPDGASDFMIKSVILRGITRDAALKSFHTDGTIEEEPDLFAGYEEFVKAFLDMIESVQNGEEVDTEAFFNDLKEQFPDLAESVDMYKELFEILGAEGLAAMLDSVE